MRRAQPYHRLRHVFQTDAIWWRFYQAHKDDIRPAVVDAMVKMFACGTPAMGGRSYRCENPDCPHVKHIPFTCHGKSCTTCGNKATAQWVSFQQATLPQTTWQHITFTFPSEFWPLFLANRWMLNPLSRLAAQACLAICKQRRVVPGLFAVLHTHGRALGWHPHLHVSITAGGLTDEGHWKPVSFHQKTLMKRWRYRLIKWLRQHYGEYAFPDSLQAAGESQKSWAAFLNTQYQRPWHVHLAEPTHDATRTLNYLCRYVKRPVVSYSRLKHYGENEVAYVYRSHVTKRQETKVFNAMDFIRHFIMHIHDRHFRVIRYYGFLANRVRREALPRVYAALNQRSSLVAQPVTYASMLKQFVNLDPFECLLCKGKMLVSGIRFGKTLSQLRHDHENLATLRPCW